ncbi:MAG: hypothetical protein LUQ67_02345, partial [Methanomicrobiales archaeon]|nr:hypothetical protein [Methanomicrobiales archaeon]
MTADGDRKAGAPPGAGRGYLRRGDPSRDQIHPGVTFARPDIRALREAGYTPVDMHFHTSHTDGLVGIPTLLARARSGGMGCAVTDHNEISGALAACRERGDLPVIPGIEISAIDGPHILLWFYSARDLEDYFLRHIRDRRCGSPWLMTELTTG